MDVTPVIGIPAHRHSQPGFDAYRVRDTYPAAIVAHGGLPVVLTPGEPKAAKAYLDLIDGLLVPGGSDVDPRHYDEPAHPNLGAVDEELDRLELELIRRAYERDMPILAICRGMQSLAVALGGSLYQDLPTQIEGERHEVREHGREHLAHAINLDPRSRLAEILGRESISVNSFHHQAVRDMPDGLTASGWAGDGIMEAAEAPSKRFVVAVQCHPEELWREAEPAFGRLFAAFVEAARTKR